MLIPFLSATVPRASGNRGRALTKDVSGVSLLLAHNYRTRRLRRLGRSKEFNIGVLIKRAYLHLSLN